MSKLIHQHSKHKLSGLSSVAHLAVLDGTGALYLPPGSGKRCQRSNLAAGLPSRRDLPDDQELMKKAND